MAEELKTNNMSKPFKMKGWSGHQNPSPVRKDWKEAVEDFKKVKKDLESKIQAIGSGDMAKKIKFAFIAIVMALLKNLSIGVKSQKFES